MFRHKPRNVWMTFSFEFYEFFINWRNESFSANLIFKLSARSILSVEIFYFGRMSFKGSNHTNKISFLQQHNALHDKLWRRLNFKDDKARQRAQALQVEETIMSWAIIFEFSGNNDPVNSRVSLSVILKILSSS